MITRIFGDEYISLSSSLCSPYRPWSGSRLSFLNLLLSPNFSSRMLYSSNPNLNAKINSYIPYSTCSGFEPELPVTLFTCLDVVLSGKGKGALN
jgi:hypothetical protein